MTVGAVLETLSGQVVTLPIDATVREAVALLTIRKIGAVPIMVGLDVVGMFSERDVIHGLNHGGVAALTQPVGDFMTMPAVTVARSLSAIGALALMTERRIRHLSVVEDGQLLGLVSIGDLVKHRIERIQHEATSLREYIQSA